MWVIDSCPEPAEGFLTLLSTHATLFMNPDRPSENSPCRFPCVGFQTVETVAICICTAYTVDAITGLYQDFRKCGLPGACPELAEGAYVVPCVRFNDVAPRGR